VATLPSERLGRAARLDAALYAEVARDERATGPALLVALGALLLDALGNGPGGGALQELAVGAARFGLAVGAIHAGARLLGLGDALGPLFRALGFAALPLALGLLDGLPGLGPIFGLAKWLALLASFAFATRAALRCETAVAAGLAATGVAVAALLARVLA
jgi:hypothetical protein